MIRLIIIFVLIFVSSSKAENYSQRVLDCKSESSNNNNFRSDFAQNSLSESFSEDTSNVYFRLGSLNGYFRLDEIYAELDKMMNKYPEMIQKKVIGSSIEGNPIYIYTFSMAALKEKKPKVLLTALHHANEPGSLFALIYYLWDLLRRYESEDLLANYILAQRIIYVLPVINPDGVLYNEKTFPNGGGMWRKNRRLNPDSTYGVDLNRNYGPEYAWNAPNNGSSIFGSLETYRGTSSFSEPETQAVRDFVEAEKDIKIAVNLHTYGNAVFYPFSYLTQTNPDSLWYRAFLTENYRRNGYLHGLDVDVIKYPNRGTSDDFLFLGSSKFNPIKSMTCEIGGPVYGFWSPIDTVINDSKKNIDFFDDVLLSADRNLALVDKELLMINNKPTLKLTIQNIGLNDVGSFKLHLRSANDSIIIYENQRYGSNLSKSDSREYLFELAPNGINNGDMTLFSLEISSDFTKIHDFRIPAYEFYEYDLFSDNLINNWVLDTNWIFKFNSNNQRVLQSNESEYYSRNLNSLASFKIPDLPFDVSRYTLRFDHWIEIETNYDFGLIVAKKGNEEFENIGLGEYMVRGSNREGGIQYDSLWGYHGAFRFWIPQTVYLNDSDDGSLSDFGFNLRTDNGVNKRGWKIRNLKLRVYPKFKEDTYITETSSKLIKITNPIYDMMNIEIPEIMNSKEIKISIYDILGVEIKNYSYLNSNNLNIDLEDLNPGVYFMKINENVLKFIKI